MLATLVMMLTVAAGDARSTPLPLRSLVLYENGVGYFERRGAVAAGQVAEIPLEAGQLDDALKSLVVISGRGVASVEFAPPLAKDAARAMAGLPGPAEQRSLLALLRALEGVDVQVTLLDASAMRGRVLEVSDDEKRTDKEGKPVDDPMLMVFGEGGLAKTPLRLIRAVRPIEGAVSRAWSRAAATMALQPEPERLVVRGSAGAGEVAVGYTTEAAVWRTTYRLVMGKSGARLQGFALVHNDSDEPWSGVRVSLASGRPTSFLFPLAGPRYGRRDLLSPEDGLATAPQLATREAQDHLHGSPAEGGGIALSGIGTTGGGRGSGSASYGYGASVTSVGDSVVSTILEDGPTPLEAAAVSEAGNLFLYTVREPVVLGARRSALLPIVDSATGAEAVSMVDASGQVFSAVRIENTTKLTLEGGTLAIFADGAYAGETQIDRIKPGEVRVVKHGVDLDVEVGRTSSRTEGETKHASVSNGVLLIKRVDVVKHELTFQSRAQVKRTALVELPEAKFRVTSGAEEDVRSPGQPRYARVTIEPRGEKTIELIEEGAVEQRVGLAKLTSQRVAELLTKTTHALPSADRQVLERLQSQLSKAEAETARAEELRLRFDQLTAEINELRETLTALGKGGAVEAAKTLGQRLVTLEAERSTIRTSQAEATKRAEHLRSS